MNAAQCGWKRFPLEALRATYATIPYLSLSFEREGGANKGLRGPLDS
jgi:hypothetical protein